MDMSLRLYIVGLIFFSGIGVTAGAHRLWSHRSYKANTPLRLLLVFSNSTAFMNPIYEFVRDHRIHHKFTDTDADPHNAKRGFFFSHMGWLMVKKHPDVKLKGKLIDMSDIEADKIVMWQRKYYAYVMPLCTFFLPAFIAMYFWGLRLWPALKLCGVMRWLIVLHGAWFVNSAAHIWGNKPYDSSISSTENPFVSFFAMGEGWHNYHHAFPWDYKTSELPYHLNFSTAFIDFFARIGWARDLKTVKKDMIIKRSLRTGDRSLQKKQDDPNENEEEQKSDHNNDIWGWNDKDLTSEQKSIAKITYQ
ncbi:hypothetical protein GE061_011600 [Apolygus lucorum]|uniref:Fatty acid desaturase domain-containing protein n=1 Tax=Apolygus lucorum TaxID=248454 RepID=A0A8S9Y201_APOLU|nr:hypothetical protein GE061_011600 [Apolygus lucorum]